MTRGAAHYGPRDDGSYVVRRAGNPGSAVLTREMIEPLLGMTMTSASKVLGVNHKTLSRYAQAFGIKFAKPVKFYPKRPEKHQLEPLCSTHSVGDIADEFGVAASTVYDWLDAFGLKALDGRRRHPPKMEEWAEIRHSALWVRKPLGKPWGGAGWHAIGTLHAMRAGE